MAQSRLQRAIVAFEWPMAILALLVIPVLVMEDRATTPQLRDVATTVNWIIWIAFAAEFVLRWADDRTLSFPRREWFDLATVASFLFTEEKTQSAETTEILARLERIEKRLEAMQNR
jgi:hypothetical protein